MFLIQVDVFDIIQKSCYQVPDNTIDVIMTRCQKKLQYRAIIQIKNQKAKSIFSKFDNF